MDALNKEIQRLMAFNGDWNANKNEYYINISVNTTNSKTIVNITKSQYLVDFTKPGTLREIFGFDSKIIATGYNLSDRVIQITNITSINIEFDLCEGSYVDGEYGSILYDFPAYTVPVGYRIIERITVPIYLPVHKKICHQLELES